MVSGFRSTWPMRGEMVRLPWSRSLQWVIHHFCGGAPGNSATDQEAKGTIDIDKAPDPGAVGTLPFSGVRM